MTPPGSDDRLAREVLSRFASPFRHGGLTALGNHGGFSGARLWRLETPVGPRLLRAWPLDPSFPSRLDFLHSLMACARREELTFVPAVFTTGQGSTWVDFLGQFWELTEFLPGRADFHASPTRRRLEAACQALAQVHHSWERVPGVGPGPCPALARRLHRFQEWRQLVQAGWRPERKRDWSEKLAAAVEQAWRVLPSWVEQLPLRLLPWTGQVWPLQPCLCDVWHDHVLFEEERVTGLVDYGAVKVDHVAVDLARLLGSLVEDDLAAWHVGLRAYRQVRSFSEREEELLHLLDRGGTVVGISNWLRWLCVEQRPFENHEAAAARLETLVRRVEQW
jgi:Ser/Thr protein kinase RdoA (MazF antagonist)